MRHARILLPVVLPFTLALWASAGAGCKGGDGGSGGTGGTAPLKDRNVVILFTSDEHSHLFASPPELDDYPQATTAGTGALLGGISRRAAVLAKERKSAKDAGKSSITVSAGDNHMGGLAQVTFGTSAVDLGAMKALGYDVTTVGNHELDFGPDPLAKAISAAANGPGLPAIVASNLYFNLPGTALEGLIGDKADDAKPIHRYRVIKTDNDIKIGVIGYAGVNAEHVATNRYPAVFSSHNLGLSDQLKGDPTVVMPEIYADLQPIVDTLRNTEKVDLVIALAHAGILDVSSDAAAKAGEDALIAANVSGIDLIISGHQHQVDPKPIRVTNAKSGKETLILNGGYYGHQVGRVDFMVHADGSTPMWDETTQTLLSVNDTTVPDADQAKAMDTRLGDIEKATWNGGSNGFLGALLGRVTGKSVTGTKAGDLYFYPLAKADFDIGFGHPTQALSADAMLVAADAWAKDNGNATTHLALESGGVIRSGLLKGKTGTISAADAFAVVPLGNSKDDGSLGYPLVRAGLTLVEIRAVFEASLVQGAKDVQLDIMPAGMKCEYDLTKTPSFATEPFSDKSKGLVRRIWLDTDHTDGITQFDKLILDLDTGVGAVTDTYTVVTSSYIAKFAADVGANPQNLAVLKRADQSEIKQFEAFMGFLAAAPNGTVPAIYDAKGTTYVQRFVCSAGCP